MNIIEKLMSITGCALVGMAGFWAIYNYGFGGAFVFLLICFVMLFTAWLLE